MFDFTTVFSQGGAIILSYLAQFNPARFGIHPFDVLIVLVVFFYVYEGYVVGFLLSSLDLVSFIGSFIIALKLYPFAGMIFTHFFGMPIGFANAVGFFFVAFIVEIILNLASRRLYQLLVRVHVPEGFSRIYARSNHWLGVIPGAFSACIILAFLLTVIVSLPSSPVIKSVVTDSQLGSRLVGSTGIFEKQLNAVFGGALNETITFLTVKPESTETINLRGNVLNGVVDPQAEQEMFALVAIERKKAGLAPLLFDDTLRDLARLHSQDMLIRGYFSHYTPEGLSPFDRMSAAGIIYAYAGENLALAPSTQLAMQGLMASPGHRANILNPNFKKIGIGVVDGGIYGKMFSQEFTD